MTARKSHRKMRTKGNFSENTTTQQQSPSLGYMNHT